MNQGEQVVLQLYEKHHPALPSHKLDEYVEYLSTIESVLTGRARNQRSLSSWYGRNGLHRRYKFKDLFMDRLDM